MRGMVPFSFTRWKDTFGGSGVLSSGNYTVPGTFDSVGVLVAYSSYNGTSVRPVGLSTGGKCSLRSRLRGHGLVSSSGLGSLGGGFELKT